MSAGHQHVGHRVQVSQRLFFWNSIQWETAGSGVPRAEWQSGIGRRNVVGPVKELYYACTPGSVTSTLLAGVGNAEASNLIHTPYQGAGMKVQGG
jgi:hypothetical protein